MSKPEERQRTGLRLGPVIAIIAVTSLLSLGFGLWSGLKGNMLFRVAAVTRDLFSSVFTELPNVLGTTPVHFLQPARQAGEGVVVNLKDDGALILISGFFDGEVGLRLIRRDGTVLARYSYLHSHHFPDSGFMGAAAPATDWNIDLHGALINPDGSVVANYEYGGTVKEDRCGGSVWTLAHPTHHSLERSETGGYWIPGRRVLARGRMDVEFPPLTGVSKKLLFQDDLILKVSDDGLIESAVSVAQILFDSGLEALLTANGVAYLPDAWGNSELVHLNKIAELPVAYAAAFPEFSAGDLLISLREHNLVAVIDPRSWRVKWHQTGPWLRQHDPEFTPDGKIRVFNNNTYRTELGPLDRSNPESPRVSNILQIDPTTRAIETVYGGRPGQEMLSVIRGKHEVLPEGHSLITEFEAGRAFEVDMDGKIVWEYVNRYNDASVAEITEARLYPAEFFSVTDWTCPAQ